jgi:hypothetical protein
LDHLFCFVFLEELGAPRSPYDYSGNTLFASRNRPTTRRSRRFLDLHIHTHPPHPPATTAPTATPSLFFSLFYFLLSSTIQLLMIPPTSKFSITSLQTPHPPFFSAICLKLSSPHYPFTRFLELELTHDTIDKHIPAIPPAPPTLLFYPNLFFYATCVLFLLFLVLYELEITPSSHSSIHHHHQPTHNHHPFTTAITSFDSFFFTLSEKARSPFFLISLVYCYRPSRLSPPPRYPYSYQYVLV